MHTVSNLSGSISENWARIEKTVEMIDTTACDMLEEKLLRLGITKDWITNAYYRLEEEIYG